MLYFSALGTNEKFSAGQSAPVRLQSFNNTWTLRVKWTQERRTCSLICNSKVDKRPKPSESSSSPVSVCRVSHISPAVFPNALSKIPRPSTTTIRLSYCLQNRSCHSLQTNFESRDLCAQGCHKRQIKDSLTHPSCGVAAEFPLPRSGVVNIGS